jgi:alpha-tubulin suppressor-like RCC1 family protein
MRQLTALVSTAAVLALAACADEPTPTRPSERAPRAAPEPSVTAAAPLAFRQLSAGTLHTCGVTDHNVAYCWGANSFGQLGDGTTTERHRPVRVASGLAFRQVSAGAGYTCGVTTDNVAYCWGQNNVAQLGIGTDTGFRRVPTRVQGRLAFRRVNADGFHTCGITTGDVVYCWGFNDFGQVGDGAFEDVRVVPTRVVGGLAFRFVSAGSFGHTCGVTTTGVAYCWGSNQGGALGIGRADFDPHPRPLRVVSP